MSRKKVFLTSLLITLAVILPVYLIVMAIRIANPISVAQNKTDVEIQTPGVGDYKNVLFITQNPDPIFILLRFDAVQSAINAAVFPADTVLLHNGQPVSLIESWQAAGPAEAAANLAETFSIRVDNYYQIEADDLVLCSAALGSVNLNMQDLGNIKDITTLKKFAYNGGVTDITPATARQILQNSELDKIKKDYVRAHIYRSFLQSDNADLAAFASELLQQKNTLTNISAVQQNEYTRIFSFLQRQTVKVKGTLINGDLQNNQYILNQESQLTCEEYFM